ncbi:MAG: PfkB family carbohydrate kinase, partial [Melioribacteraceae bacterium]
VGAGDAFASAVLFALHENLEIDKILKLGVSTAAVSLQDVSCSDGIVNYKECLKIGNKYSYKKLIMDMIN